MASEQPKLLHRAAAIVAKSEIWLLLILYAWFVISDDVPLICFAALGLVWIARWAATGRLTVATPMDPLMLALLLLMPLSLLISVDLTLTRPKVYGVVLSVAFFYAVVNRLRTRRDIQLGAWILALGSLALAPLEILMTNWSGGGNQILPLPQIQQYLPHLMHKIPRTPGGGFNPNGTGGTLIFLIPLLVSLLWEREKMELPLKGRLWRLLRRIYKPALFLAALLNLFVLLLTQSLSAYIGLAVGLLALAVWRDLRFLLVVPAMGLVIFRAIQVFGGDKLMAMVLQMDVSGGGATRTMQTRIEMWQRAIYMIQDFSFTGIGLGSFDPVVDLLYPLFTVSPATTLGHVHNTLLEVGVDLGIPGLVLYVTLLSSFAFAAWRSYRGLEDGSLRALVMGLACGMLAHQVFGLADAFLLGTKPGLVMWVFMAVVAAIYAQQRDLSTPRARDILLPLGYWVMFSLLSISFVGNRPYVALGLAIAGGTVLGWMMVNSEW